MAKGQLRSNREQKKPKKTTPVPSSGTAQPKLGALLPTKKK